MAQPLPIAAVLHPATIAAAPPVLGPLAFATADEGWAGTDGGVYETTDGGRHWRLQLPTSAAVDSVALAAGGDVWASAGDTLYHSGDSGRTWTSSVPGGGALLSLTFPTATDGWAVQGQGPTALVRTTDGGRTWTQVKAPCAPLTAVTFPAAADGWVLCGGGGAGGDEDKEVYSSTDGGDTWTEVASAAFGPDPGPLLGGIPAALVFRDPLHGWILSGGGASGAFAFATPDGGRTWTTLLRPRWEDADGVSFPTPQTGYLSGGYAGSTELLRTDNGGKTWTRVWPAPGPFDGGRTIESLAAGGGTAWADDGTQLLRSGDGGATWTAAAEPPDHPQAIATGDGRTLFAVTEDANGKFAVQRGGAGGWTSVPLPLGASPRVISAGGAGGLWLATDSGTLYRSSDGGATWDAVPAWTPTQAGPLVESLAVVSATEAWAVGTGLLYHVADGAWTAYAGPPSLGFVDVAFADGRHGAALADDGGSCSLSTPCQTTLLTTDDGGAHWTQRPLPGVLPGAVAMPSASTILLLTAAGVMRSTDGGASWDFPAEGPP